MATSAANYQQNRYDPGPRMNTLPYSPYDPPNPSSVSVPMRQYSTPLQPPRTPSPTPSDIEELKKGVIDVGIFKHWRTLFQKKYIGYWIAFILSIVLVALLTIFHKKIVDWLTPGAQVLKKLHGGWAIPIGVMFVLSFPPLFGNEIVHVLCGIVWGLWIGFGIVCAGTFLGEVGNFYAFRYCCQSRGDKLEKTSLFYACLAKVVRDGGFIVAVILRLSVIPGHFTTAVFSTCGMSIWSFALGAFLSLPKQFATVYIGVVLFEAAGVETTQQKIVSGVVLTLSLGVTLFAGWWVLMKMNKAKPFVLAERRKQKAMDIYKGKMFSTSSSDFEAADMSSISLANNGAPYGQGSVAASSTSTVTTGKYPPQPQFSNAGFDKPFNSADSSVQLPLSVKPQRWDANGRAILDDRYDYNNGNQWQQNNGRPAGAAPPAIQTRLPPPDIRVIRASGASSMTAPPQPQSPFDDPPELQQRNTYDVPLTTPTQTSSAQNFNRPPANYDPRASSDEGSGENAPQWAAGVAREDEKEVMTPLTASGAPSSYGPSGVPPSQNTTAGRRDYSEMDLYNPYDERSGSSNNAPGHRYEDTESSIGSFHTARATGASSGGASPQLR